MGFMDELKRLARPYEDEDEDDFNDFETVDRSHADNRRSSRAQDTAGYSIETERRSNKVVNIHTTTQMQVVLAKPDRFDMVSEIADHLRDKHAVVLNLEATNKDIARRLVDFLSGCVYALDGDVKKIAQSAYLFCPHNMDIVGDLESLQAEVESYV